MRSVIPQPDGWRLTTIGALATHGSDAVVGGPFGSSLTTKDYVPTGVPVIRGSNLSGEECQFIDDDFVYVSDEKAIELSRNTAEPGDVIFTQRGTLGQVAIIPADARFSTYIVSQSQMRVRVDEEAVLPRFLYWQYRGPFARRYLESRTLATGVPHINLGILKDFPAALPPLPEQRRIAAILDEADALRRTRREALGLLDELLRSTFLEMFGDPVTNPRGWPVVRLGDVCDFVGGGTPSRAVPEFFTGDICWATSKDMGVHDLVDTQEHITDEAISSSATKLVPAGCLLVVVKSKVLAHTLPVAVARVPVCFGQDLKALVPKRDWPAEYLAWHLRIGQTPLLERARGANTEGLTLEHLREYVLLKPPLDLRARFVVQKQAIAAMQAGAQRAARETEALFASLLHRAFSGEL